MSHASDFGLHHVLHPKYLELVGSGLTVVHSANAPADEGLVTLFRFSNGDRWIFRTDRAYKLKSDHETVDWFRRHDDGVSTLTGGELEDVFAALHDRPVGREDRAKGLLDLCRAAVAELAPPPPGPAV